MNRFWLITGAGIGFVLGSRAGRARYEQLKALAEDAAQSRPAQQAGELARRGLDAASDGIGKLTGQLQEQSRQIPGRVVHTTESLKEEFSRRYAAMEENASQLVERSRERQTNELNEYGDRRESMLDSLESDDDEMIGHTEDRRS